MAAKARARPGAATRHLTLRDRLSRLTFEQACKLLGPEGKRLINEGGKREIALEGDVYLGDDLFRLSLGDATVTITLTASARQRLHWNCDRCSAACEHAGAAFSLILEEKTALGLAAPPPEREPVERLSEEEVVRRALQEREERSRTERMTVRSVDPDELWSDYLVTNPATGKTYRVALRGWERGESYCTCPDFRANTLGTCKHILNVTRKASRRFPAAVRARPFRPTEIAVHLGYGDDLELRLQAPEKLDDSVARRLRPFLGRAIDDVHGLLRAVRALEADGHRVTVYPDAEEHIARRLFAERIRTLVEEVRRDPANHPLRTELLKTELLPYQLDGVAFAVGAGRAVLADDMGLGKTIQGIGVAELLAREAGARRTLIVCPASLKSQWRSEIHRFSDRDCRLVLGSAAERARQYEGDTFFTVCNYEQALRDILAIERVPWDLIILDEGQRIKNWEAKTTRVVKGLRSRFALVLSGTPLENRLDDLFSVVEFVDDRRLGPAFRFFNRHRVADEKGKTLGYRDLAALREQLRPILLRRTRASVMRELPPRMTEVVRITPTDEQLELHSGQMRVVSSIVRKPYLTEMDLLRLRKALLLCRMTANSTFLVEKRPPGHSSKLAELGRLLAELAGEEDRKTLLFSEWTTMLGLIEPLLDKNGLGYVRLDGSVPQKKRQALVHAFRHDPERRFFITTNAGATGLNLQAANTVINVDLPWNPAVLEQRISRAHRMGQKRPVQVFILITEQTIEESLLQTLSAKHELAMAALDMSSDVDAVDLEGGIDELKRRLEVLLGAVPEAPLDETVRADREAEATRLARREKVAEAGGRLLGAAFAFLGEMAPPAPESETSRRAAEDIRQRLTECVDRDEDGRMKLTVTLPDESALKNLADSLARFLHLGNGPTA